MFSFVACGDDATTTRDAGAPGDAGGTRDSGGSDGAMPDAGGEVCTMDQVVVSPMAGGAFAPTALVWNGSGWAMSWGFDTDGDGPEIYFVRMEADGTPIGTPLRVTNAPRLSLFSDLAAGDNGFGVVWNDDRDGTTRAYFQRLSEAGAPIRMPAQVGPNDGGSYGGSIEWNGAEFGVSFTQEVGGAPDNAEIYFTRFDADGARIGTEIRMRDAEGTSDVSSPAHDGDAWAVAWRDNRGDPMSGEIYYAAVTATGPGAEVNLTMDAGDSTVPALVWNGTLFGVGWHSLRGMPMPEEKRFLRICP